MLTYTLDKQAGLSLYEQLYRRVKADILSGRLAAGGEAAQQTRPGRPSGGQRHHRKECLRTADGRGLPHRRGEEGLFRQRRAAVACGRPPASPGSRLRPAEPVWFLDLATNSIAAEDFPFTVWARLMRQTILEQGTGLLRSTPPQGAWALRRAIAAHLRQFRAMEVTAEQIIVGCRHRGCAQPAGAAAGP